MQRHPRRVIAVAITIFGLLGLFLFSIVFIPNQQFSNEPNIINPPTVPLGSESSSKELPAENLPIKQTDAIVSPGDNLSLIFHRLQLQPKTLIEIANIPLVEKSITHLQAGQQLEFIIDSNDKLVQLTLPISHTENIVIKRLDNKFVAKKEAQAVDVANRLVDLTIDTSLNAAGTKADIPRAIIASLIKIYAWKIDFSRDLRRGDHIAVLYQLIKNLKTGETEPGKILAAVLQQKDQSIYAFRYRDQYGRVGYYDRKGKSLRKAFLRKPVEIGYISSPFSLHRVDPVLKRVRPHTGTDFAAPYGTPIHATGDGKIILHGRKGGYGRTIVISHGNGITTLYGHMSRFNPKFKAGSYVKMNDVIGYIGSSGWSTGPHVHYEFRIKNHYKNPMKVALPDAQPISPSEKSTYLKEIKPEMAQLDSESDSQSS